MYPFTIYVIPRTGTGGGSVQAPPAGKPTADSVPATVEQAAVDESYKSGDSPYEFSQVRQLHS